jgi:hypothetical protein
MTAATKIERSGPAIRAALAELSPDECAQFEVEFQQDLPKTAAGRTPQKRPRFVTLGIGLRTRVDGQPPCWMRGSRLTLDRRGERRWSSFVVAPALGRFCHEAVVCLC